MISQEAFTVACAALKHAQKTTIDEAFKSLETLFYTHQELQIKHRNHDMLLQLLERSQIPVIQENEMP